MYKIILNDIKNKYEFEELIKVFLRPSDYSINENEVFQGVDFNKEDITIEIPKDIQEKFTEKKDKKNSIKRILYNELKKNTGYIPDWGILTGVRPVKLAGELLLREGSVEKVREILLNDYYLSPEKAELLLELCMNQSKVVGKSPSNAVGIYIGIPFCPTRCVYCSFTSNKGTNEQIKAYLDALHQEITFVAAQMERKGWYPESIYVGGGTPTSISAEELYSLLQHIRNSFDLKELKEFTVEAGRPDTITKDKLQIIKELDVNRISINPQSMNSHTLECIGRSHKPEDIIEAFRLAREIKIPIINADIIAGLPEENVEDFMRTLREVLKLNPENITVHTLALKRASRLKEIDGDYNYSHGNMVKEMLTVSRELLSRSGLHPYYLYRQKQMTGSLENIGYARPCTEGIYNIRIMEEMQTIIALGAGGISKIYYPLENRLERVANVSNYEIYIERLEEMLQRKADNLFGIGGLKC